MLDFRQHASTDEDLSRLGFTAKTRGDVGNGANSRVIKSSLETDCPKSSEAVRNAVKSNLQSVPGVKAVSVSYEAKTAVVTFDDTKTNAEALKTATTNAGYPSRVADAK